MLDKLKFILSSTKQFTTIINRDYEYEIANEAFCNAFHINPDAVVGKAVSDIWGIEKFNSSIKDHLDDCFTGREVKYVDKFKFGFDVRFLRVVYYPYYYNGEVTHALVISQDITKRRSLESKVKILEYRDRLTGLWNRKAFNIILSKELDKAKRSKTENLRGVLFVSLENFARINQSYGHEIGDILLENSGLKIKHTLRNSDYVFRFEGNELTVILTQFKRNTDVAKVAQKINNVISMPYRFKGTDIFINCKIGVTVYPDDGHDRDTLIKNASAAMQEAKKRNEGFILYNRELHLRALERIRMESDIYNAFGKEQFLLHYQPIVDRERKMLGAEGLIRWNHPERGRVPPADFIPVAEESGIIVSIGKWALYNVCKQLKKWLDYSIYLSVNLSAGEFEHEKIVETIDGAIISAGRPDPRRLKLEVTETESMKNPEDAINKMDQLNSRGIEICIDDFGTGQSSLRYLKVLPAEVLKVDKVFVDDIVENEEEREYLASIVRMVHSRKKKVLVEGVETSEQFDLLLKMDCDLFQGFYFSKPVAPEVIEDYLSQGKPLPLKIDGK
jgi:diguanylate cyclase (GGDEF)-like protein